MRRRTLKIETVKSVLGIFPTKRAIERMGERADLSSFGPRVQHAEPILALTTTTMFLIIDPLF